MSGAAVPEAVPLSQPCRQVASALGSGLGPRLGGGRVGGMGGSRATCVPVRTETWPQGKGGGKGCVCWGLGKERNRQQDDRASMGSGRRGYPAPNGHLVCRRVGFSLYIFLSLPHPIYLLAHSFLYV